jgi:transcriptional regulator with XRE-family HTH domain
VADPKHTRASRRLEAVRREWDISGAEIGRELDVKQATASRILTAHLIPGRDLLFKIQGLYFVPVAWWGEEPRDPEPEPLPVKPSRYDAKKAEPAGKVA